MICHVLPGDAHVDDFLESGIEGEMLVCREALVEGDISGGSLDEFFANRAAYITRTYGEDPSTYKANVASQFRRLLAVWKGDEIHLWFEYELFCAVNMWFCLSLLENLGADVYRVPPAHLTYEDRWNGFGGTRSEDLQQCFNARVRLTNDDIQLGSNLWQTFRKADREALLRLSATPWNAFPYLREVGEAAAAIDSAPARVIAEIQSEGIDNFNDIFLEFRRRAGVYGYGDSQVRNLLTA